MANELAPRNQPEEKEKPCPFCQIVEGKAPSFQILDDERALAFMSLDGHPLVVPKKHISEEDLEDSANLEDLNRVSEIAWKLIPAVKAVYDVTGVNVVTNIGKLAGQDIPHVHTHVIPRVQGDGKLTYGKFPKIDAQERQRFAEGIKSSLTKSS